EHRHNLFDRKAFPFHDKPPPGSGSSLPQNSRSDRSRIPKADHPWVPSLQLSNFEGSVHLGTTVSSRAIGTLEFRPSDEAVKVADDEYDLEPRETDREPDDIVEVLLDEIPAGDR
uniref:hypothetical protein n=1 Tax=Burkholderia cepacia TaxID=292 RepID=UPI001ABA9FED